MLEKEKRVKKKKDFENIFKNSKSLRCPLFILKANKNDFGKNRFGFVVSLKVSKKATIRNKIRRRLKAIIKSLEKNVKPGTDMVFIVLPASEKKEFTEIKEAVKKTLLSGGYLLNNNQ